MGTPGHNRGHLPQRHTPNCVKTSTRMSFNSFHAIPTVWDHQSAQSHIMVIFGHFWTMLALFGRSWAKIWDIPRKDTLPTVPKPQPGCPVTRSMPFQPFGTTRVLKVRFWPFYAIFGHFWTILALFGGSWTKIGETLALPTGSKLQPGCPVTCSTPFQPFWITRALQQER